MKFIIDANLPYKLSIYLKSKKYDVIHTDDLPNKEKSTDDEIRKVSLDQNRIIITKDTDFLDSHLLQNIPPKLLIVTTGNIVNKLLLKIFYDYFDKIVSLFKSYKLIEINSEEVIAHE